MKNSIFILYLSFCLHGCTSQQKENGTSPIKLINDTILPHTPIENQGQTPTCWAYTMASMMESEFLCHHNDTMRISTMYAVRQKYMKQFDFYYYSQGKQDIRAGGLGHSFLNVYKEKGAIPADIYKGYTPHTKRHDHRKLLKKLKHLAEKAVNKRDLYTYRKQAEEYLDKEMGIVPDTFIYRGITYTPHSFADSLGLKTEEYIEITSFTHHPFHEWFILEVPDNWEHAPFYNLPLEELVQSVKNALSEGYTVAWDGDISEAGFDSRNGIAVYLTPPSITQIYRQQEFEKFKTTDDHMMHLIGTAHDNEGHLFYVLKNSWGKHGTHQGYIYMSKNYFRAKTISITLPKKFVDIRIK